MRILITILASLFFHCSFAQNEISKDYIRIFHVGCSDKYFYPIDIYPQYCQIDTAQNLLKYHSYRYSIHDTSYQRIKQYIYQYYRDNKDTTVYLQNVSGVNGHFYKINRERLGKDFGCPQGFAIANYCDTPINLVCILYSEEENKTFFHSFCEFLSTMENTQQLIDDIKSRAILRFGRKQ